MTDHMPERETDEELLESQRGKGYGEDEGEREDGLSREGDEPTESPIEGP